MTRTLGLIALSTLLVTGCKKKDDETPSTNSGPSSAVSGEVTDANGFQNGRFAGDGTLAATTSVEAHILTSDGELELAGSAAVEADGTYQIGVDSVDNWMIVQALDTNGDVLGSVAVEPASGLKTEASPLTSETSAEADVWIELIAREHNEADWAVVRALIDTPLAIQMRAEDAEAATLAVTDAVQAWIYTEAEAWADAGADISDTYAARTSAAVALSADLVEDSPSAYDRFLDAYSAASNSAGAGPEKRSAYDAQCGLAFRATVDAHAVSEALTVSAARASIMQESRSHRAATEIRMEAAGGGNSDLQDLEDIHGIFEQDVIAASTKADVNAARTVWTEAIMGTSDSATDGGLFLEAGSLTASEGAIDVAYGIIDSASDDFTVLVRAEAQADIGASFDVEDLAEDLVEAWSEDVLAAQTSAKGPLAGPLSGKADSVVEISLEVATAYRGL